MSRFIYRGLHNGYQKYNEVPDTSKWPAGLKKSWSNQAGVVAGDKRLGYQEGSNIGTAAQAATSSRIVSDTFPQAEKMGKSQLTDFYGIDTRSLSFGLPSFTHEGRNIIDDVKRNAVTVANKDNTAAKADGFDPTSGGKYNASDYAGLAAYALMSESPYYAFSWNMYDQGLSSELNSTGGYKGLVLPTGDDKSYFYNMAGNGEMKDFTNMRALFTYIMPYLRSGNNIVRAYDNKYGLVYNKGVPSVEGYENDPVINKNPVLKRQYWQNLNISRLYEIYSPWVDLMDDSNYAKPENINVQGEKVSIRNPLDPSTYPSNRPMVFSKSEQVDYGLKDSDLTEAERMIQRVQQSTMDSMYNLLNYYNFNDSVLNTAAAINATFAFNREFSRHPLIGNPTNLYPQSYELKNFSYDAYLRLAMSSASHEDLSSAGDEFYLKVVQNSSFVTSVLMILLDIESIYVVPILKLGFLLMTAALMLLTILSVIVRIEEGRPMLQNVWRGILRPILYVCSVSILMALAVGLFMSDGRRGITGGSDLNMSTGDPALTVTALVAINTAVLVLLWRIVKAQWGQVRASGAALATSLSATLRSVGQGLTAAVGGPATSPVSSGGSGKGSRGHKGVFSRVAGAAAGAAAVVKGGLKGGLRSAARRDRSAGHTARSAGHTARSGVGSFTGSVRHRTRNLHEKTSRIQNKVLKGKTKREAINSLIDKGKSKLQNKGSKSDSSWGKYKD